MQRSEAQIEDWRDKAAALDESINDLQQVLLAASEELEKLEGRKEVLKERKKNTTQNKSQLEKTQVELEEKISSFKEKDIQETKLLENHLNEVQVIEHELNEKQTTF